MIICSQNEVCPPIPFDNPNIDCPEGRKIGCCSTTECSNGQYCCLVGCETSCVKPGLGDWKDLNLSKEECKKVKEGGIPESMDNKKKI
ncbi:hypothetical protein AVEN_273335-1 [Araneus ventricosus]|uniref:WAP domain-containing protein n=1 Tax=Araneus ventricosus TaxID=182803 RepID=A0A4Y2IM22_ARAVE|nr:hypothetical protein AVEN_273335-1 [Araneus ventricosus]